MNPKLRKYYKRQGRVLSLINKDKSRLRLMYERLVDWLNRFLSNGAMFWIVFLVLFILSSYVG